MVLDYLHFVPNLVCRPQFMLSMQMSLYMYFIGDLFCTTQQNFRQVKKKVTYNVN